MEDAYLIGNERIEAALDAVSRTADEQSFSDLLNALGERMAADGHLLLPVTFPDPEDESTFMVRSISSESGDAYLACFTREEEARKGEPTALVSQFIDVFFEAVMRAEHMAGIAINPFGTTCRLPKSALQLIMEENKAMTVDYEWQNQQLEKAIRFATEKHAGQLRKGTMTPYIVHPLETMNILRSMNADTELLIAGLLHDTVEDTDTTAEEIAGLFGDGVAALVGGHSEDKSRTWAERKTHAIEELAKADRRMKMLVMADKVSNLRSMAADLREVGDELWARFNAPREKQAWYYSGIEESLRSMMTDPDAGQVYWEMVGLYKDVFVTYYHVTELCPPGYTEEYLLQVCADGSAYRLDKGCPRWMQVRFSSSDLDDDCREISRRDAEQMEDIWNAPFWDRIESDLADGVWPLVNNRRRHVSIRLREGKLTLEGQDLGADCQSMSGEDEYEYFVSLDEDNSKRLLTQLRMEYGTGIPLQELLRQALGREAPSSRLMEYCREKRVQYTYVPF